MIYQITKWYDYDDLVKITIIRLFYSKIINNQLKEEYFTFILFLLLFFSLFFYLWLFTRLRTRRDFSNFESRNFFQIFVRVSLEKFPFCLSEFRVLDWFDRINVIYPGITILYLENSFIPSSTMPSERLFSSLGNILSKRRYNLSSKSTSQLLFVKSYLLDSKRKKKTLNPNQKKNWKKK